MTIRIVERPSSRHVSQTYSESNITLEYGAWGSSDEQAILDAVSDLAPSFYTLDDKQLFRSKIDAATKDAYGWDVKLDYGKDPNYVELSVDLGVATSKRMQSIETISQYECYFPGMVTPTFDRAINLDGQTIHGVDTEIPKFDFTILKRLKLTTLDAGYIQTLYDMLGKVNDEVYSITWAGQTLVFGPQELKFVGAPFKQNGFDDLDITFKFSAQKSITEDDGITVGDSLPIEKKGWEYLWVYYQEVVDPVLKIKRRRPIFAIVEKVFDTANFLDLDV